MVSKFIILCCKINNNYLYILFMEFFNYNIQKKKLYCIIYCLNHSLLPSSTSIVSYWGF